MGLSIGIAFLVALRVGRNLEHLTPTNMEESVEDITCDTLKDIIHKKLESLFGLNAGTDLPDGLSVHEIMTELYFDIDNLEILITIANDLWEKSAQSPYF